MKNEKVECKCRFTLRRSTLDIRYSLLFKTPGNGERCNLSGATGLYEQKELKGEFSFAHHLQISTERFCGSRVQKNKRV